MYRFASIVSRARTRALGPVHRYGFDRIFESTFRSVAIWNIQARLGTFEIDPAVGGRRPDGRLTIPRTASRFSSDAVMLDCSLT